MRFLPLSLALLAATAIAQQQPPTGAPNAAVIGVVKDAVTGKPLAGYNVSTDVGVTWNNNTIVMNSSSKQVKSITDENGRYRLGDLPPGTYRIQARDAQSFSGNLTKRVAIAGQDLEGMDFSVMLPGSISGKVTDENKEPVPGLRVHLVSREYFSGVLGYFIKESSVTDDRGEYTLKRVEPRRSYLVMAAPREQKLPAHSQVPLDPKLRRRIPVSTFYPNSPVKEGAAAVTLQPAERREHVDIELKKSQSYCLEGTLTSSMGPGALNFTIGEMQPAYGQSSTGGVFGAQPAGRTGPDGKLRICDLWPGAYRLAITESSTGAGPNNSVPNHSMNVIAIGDRDLSNFQATVGPGASLDGEVVWDGAPPAQPVTARVSLSLVPLLRGMLQGEHPGARTDIPGTFQLPGLVLGDYAVRPLVNSPGRYIKDVTYGGNSIMNQPLHLGQSLPGGLRIVVGQDGASINAQVNNKDGLPVPDLQVIVIPANVSSEAMLQATMFSGETNQTGQFSSHTVAPGKYYVAATAEIFDATSESVGRLWRARNRFQEVDLAPSGAAQVTLAPLKVE
jgi:Carboxypeptidase regulatory-like domain